MCSKKSTSPSRRATSQIWNKWRDGLWSPSRPGREILETVVESLEERMMLTASPVNLTIDSVDFVGDISQEETLYLRLNANTLEFSQTGANNSFKSDLDGNLAGEQSLSFSANTLINIDLGIGSDQIFIDESLQDAMASVGGTISVTSDLASDLTGADTLAAVNGSWEATVSGNQFLNVGAASVTGGMGSLAIETSGDIAVNGDWFTAYDLSLTAAEGINVASGVTISSRQVANNNAALNAASNGDSHNITFVAPNIDVGSGAQILAHATDGFEIGDVTFTALDDQTGIDTPIFKIDVVDAASNITLDDATIRGGDIAFTSTALSSSNFYDDEAPGAAILNFLDGISEVGGVAVTTASAEINVGAGTMIDGQTVSFDSRADAESAVTTLGTTLAVAYGESNPHAKIIVEDGVTINSAGDITVGSLANSTMAIQAKQGLLPQKSQSSIDITVAAGLADIQSVVEIAGGSSLTAGGNVSVVADMNQSQDVTSKAAAYEDGSVGGAIAWSTSVSDVHAYADGTIIAGGDVSVAADSTATKNDTSAEASVGGQVIFDKILPASDPTTLTGKVGKFIRDRQPETSSSTGGTQRFAISAAFTYSDHANDVTARIGENATVESSSGSVNVGATILSVPEVSSITKVDSDAIDANKPGANTKESSNSVAVVVADFDNSTSAYIGANAVVDAFGDVNVHAETKLPFTFEWAQLNGVSDVTDKLNANLGIQNGFVTSWAQSSAEGTKSAIAGSLSFNSYDTSSHAWIADGARVNENIDSGEQNVSVTSNSIVEMVNLSGLPFVGGQTTGGSGAGGSYLEMNFINDTSAEIHTGAEVYGTTLLVSADTTLRNISIAISGGVADKLAFNGSGSVANVDSRTIARIDDGATIATDSSEILEQQVLADDNTQLFNLTGGITKSQSVGIGFSAGVNNITRNTQALIGNESTSIGDGTFAPGVGVDSAGNIQLGYAHGFATGDVVTYSSGGGAEIDGLTSGTSYIVTVVDATTVRLEKTGAAATDAAETFFGPGSVVGSTASAELMNTINLGYTHNYQTGESVVYRAGGGNAIGGLADGATYYVVVVDATKIALVESQDAAENSAKILFAATNVDDVANSIGLGSIHDFRTGDAVVYSNGGAVSIDGLVDGETYFVAIDDSQSIFLAATAEAALLGTDLIDIQTANSTGNAHSLRRALRIELDATAATGDSHSFRLGIAPSAEANDANAILKSLDPASSVNEDTNSIDLEYQHGFTTGQAIVYENGGGDSIGGLASGETYYVVVVDATTISLADSAADAISGTPRLVELDPGVATGTSHGFGGAFRNRPSVDSSTNTISFTRQHSFATGDTITYQTDGNAIGGLVSGQTYHVIVIDANTIQLAASQADAVAETPTAIGLDGSVADSVNHDLRGIDDADGSITATGGIEVAAMNRGVIGSLSIAGTLTNDSPTGAKKTESKSAASTKTKATRGVSIAGSISINTITDTTVAAIRDASADADVVTLTATNDSDVYALAGTVAIASAQSATAGLAGSYSDNTVNNSTIAAVENADVQATGGDLLVTALSRGEIRSIAASGAGVTRKAVGTIAGQVAFNDINNTIAAHVTSGSSVNTAGNLEITSTDNSLIHAIAGAATFGGKFGFGASIASNRIDNETRAEASNSKIETESDFTVSATTASEIQAITAAVGVSKQGMVGAFGVSFNTIATDAVATIADINANDQTMVGGDLTVSASDDSTIKAIAGGLAASGTTAGIGGGFGINNVQNSAVASIESAFISAAGVSTIEAASTSLIETITAGGAGAQTFALGGSVSLNNIANTTTAKISDQSVVDSDGGISVASSDDSTIRGIAGTIAVATGTVAVGGAVSFNEIGNTTHAFIESSEVQSSGGNIDLLAESTSTIESITAGGSFAGTAGVAGSVGSQYIANDVQAYLDSATATADGTVTAVANAANTIDTIVGAIQAGGTLGIGGSVGVTNLAGTTKAFVANSNINADGNGESMVPVSDDSPNQLAVRGLAVVAKTTNDVDVITANGSGGGTAGVAATVSVQLVEDTTEAYITQSTINDSTAANVEQRVLVAAANDSDVNVIAGGLGIGGTAGVGATHDNTFIGNTTKAYIAGQSVVHAAASIDVATNTEERINSITVSGAGAGTVGIAGNVVVTNVDSVNEAYVDDSTLESLGNIIVTATDEVYLGVLENGQRRGIVAGALGVGFGAVGVGGAVAVNTIGNTTTASISNSIVDAAGMLAVDADTTEDIVSFAISGAGGFYVGAAGAVTVNTIESSTLAIITGTSTVINDDSSIASAEQNVRISTNNDANIEVVGGAATAGSAAIGAAVDVSTIKNSVNARLNSGTQVNATGSLDVTASSDNLVETILVAGGAGLGSIQGSVSVVNIGSATTGQANEAATGANGAANSQIGGSKVGNQLGDSSAAERAKARSDARTSLQSVDDEFDTAANAVQSTYAAIEGFAKVNVGGDINVESTDRTQVKVLAGVSAGGLLGAGGGVGIANLHNQTGAYVGLGATLSAGGDVNVNARGQIADTDVLAVAGTAGVVGLGAAVAVLNSDNDVTASILNNATVEQADAVNVVSSAISNLHADAQGASLGAVAAGVMVSDASETGTSFASLAGGVSIGTTPRPDAVVNDLTVNALSNHTVKATGIAAAGGLGPAGAGNFSTATLDTITLAIVQDEANVSVRDDIVIATNAINDVDAEAYGVVGSLIIAAGATTATANVTPNVIVSIGSSSELAAGDDITIRSRSVNDVNTAATGASGGLVSGALVRANTTVTNETYAYLRSGSKVTARDTLDVSAESRIDADSTSTSDSIGGATLGDSRANTIIDSDTIIDVEALAELAAKVTKIHAKATRLEANATALYNSSITLANIAEANARVAANSVAEVISRGGDIAGYGRLELVARQTGVSTGTSSTVNAGLVPFVKSVSNNNADIRSNIDVQSGSKLRGTDVLVEADSALIAIQRFSDVNSLTIDALEGAIDVALDVLAGAQAGLRSAEAGLTAALSELSAAQDDLADAQGDLAAAQQAITDFIEDECGHLSGILYTGCVVGLNVLLSPLRLAVGTAQAAVGTAQLAVTAAEEVVAGAREVVRGAQSVVSSAENGLTSARNDLANAFGVERLGAARRSNNVTLNGELFAGAVADRITINADGTISGGASGLSGQVVGDEFILNPVDPDNLITSETASLEVNAGGGRLVGSINGTLNIREDVGLAALTVSNNFAGSTRIGDIESAGTRTITTTVTQNASNRRLFTPKVAGLPSPEIAIEGSSQSQIYLDGNVDAISGTINVANLGSIVVLGALETSGAITVSSARGSIINSADKTHFTAGTLNLSALGRLGNENFNLQTSVAGLITASAIGVLAITDVDGDMDIDATSQFQVFLEAANRIDGSVVARDIELTTDGVIGSATPFVIQTPVAGFHGDSTGSLNATAGQDVNVAITFGMMELENVTSAAGEISVTSIDDLVVSGAVTAGENVSLQSDASIRILGGSVVADLTSGVVVLDAGQDLLMLSDQPIQAHRLEAIAGNALYLETDVDVIEATSRFAGALEIREANDVVLENVTNLDGSIGVIAEGNITANAVQSLTDTPETASFVGLISRSGDVNVGQLFADVNAGQVSVSAAGEIVDLGSDAATDVTAALVMMNAGGDIDIDVDAAELFTFADGRRIRVNTDSSLELFLETDADVVVTTDGDLRASHVQTSGRNVTLKSNDGDIHIGSVSSTDSRGRIRIQANGDGEFGNIIQAATQTNGESHEVVAGRTIDLRARGDVEIGGNLQSGNLLKISNRSGDVEILGLASAARSVDIRSRGDLNVAGEIVSGERDVKLSADDEIVIQSTSTIESGNNTSLRTRFGNINIFGNIFAGLFSSRSTRGDIRIDAGGDANIEGELDALGEVINR